MRLLPFIATILVLLVVNAKALPYGDDNNDIYSNDEYEDDDKDGNNNSKNSGGQHQNQQTHESVINTVPHFVTTAQNDLVNEGATIRLPCIVDRLEGFVLLWKKGEDIITVANQVIGKTDRFKLEPQENGNVLVISLAEEEDAGNYTCQVSTYKPSELQHRVRIRVRPEVQPVPESGMIVASTGSTVTLACQVTKGSPAPEVKWHRKERKMPSGEDELRGLSLTYTSVTRHHSGVYVCSADNGFGEATTTVLKLDVQHSPEIEQEETFIHTGAGDETEVICVVHSSPKAEVTWLKDGVKVDPGSTPINQRGNRHTLLIAKVAEESFGDYTCQAENRFGKASKTTRVSGKAGDVTFKSDPKGASNDRYQLEWSAQSSTPITNFKVAYKPEKSSSNQWREKEVPAINLERNFYSGDYTMADLSPRTVFVAKVASKNSYGYNEFGAEFKFATKGADPVQKPITAGSGGIRNFQSSAALFLALVISRIMWL